jgi:hypothetical protein
LGEIKRKGGDIMLNYDEKARKVVLDAKANKTPAEAAELAALVAKEAQK